MTRVLGLDIALTATGVARVDGTYITLRPPSKAKDYWRHAWLELAARELLELEKPDVVIVEDYAPRSPGILATIRAAEAQGIVRKELTRAGIPWVAVKPNVLKLFATGKGNAKKEAMADAAKADLPRGAPAPANFDEADAYWLRTLGAAWYDAGGATGTEHRDRALASVNWAELTEGATP